MLKDNGHIDKIFSEGLKDLSVPPRPELWGKINADIKLGRRRKRAAVIFISLAAAASLALLFTLSNTAFFQQNQDFGSTEMVSEAQGNSIESEKTIGVENQLVAETKSEKSIIKTEHDSKMPKKELLALNQGFTASQSTKRKIVMQMVLPETQMNALKNSSLTMELFEKKSAENNHSDLSYLKDSLIIARNLRMLDKFNKTEGEKKEWSILGQISSAYSSYKGDKSGNNSEDGLISIGGGVKLNWQTGKKLAIQTGIIYNKFGQQLAGSNQVFEAVAVNSDLTKQADFNSDIETSAGKIKMKGSSKLFDSNELSLNTLASSSPDMVQSFEAIEIPFVLRYSLIDKKFGLHVSGGLSTNFMIGNRVYDKSSRQTLGETSGIRSTNFSTSFSLGMEYQLSSKFSLSLEPALKYYLNSINKDSDFNYKPYSIGLNSGIRYKF